MTDFSLRFSPGLLPLFRLMGIGPRQTRVTVRDAVVEVRMGWGFRSVVPREWIREATPDSGPVSGWGVHGWGGTWLVNGSSHGLVRLRLDPPARATVMFVPVRVDTLRLSLQDPASFLALVAPGEDRS